MPLTGGRSSSGVDREMVEKWDEGDNCNDGALSFKGVLGLSEGVLSSFEGVLSSSEGVLSSFEGVPSSFGGLLESLRRVLGSFEVDTGIVKLPVDIALSPSLSLPRSEMYLAISSRISSGDKIYDDMSSAASKASSSSSTRREGGLEVIV